MDLDDFFRDGGLSLLFDVMIFLFNRDTVCFHDLEEEILDCFLEECIELDKRNVNYHEISRMRDLMTTRDEYGWPEFKKNMSVDG